MCVVISSELAACPSHWKPESLIKHLCTIIVIEVKDIVTDFQGLPQNLKNLLTPRGVMHGRQMKKPSHVITTSISILSEATEWNYT